MGNKKYTVKDFCKKYNEAKSDQIKETLVKSVMNTHYVPYENKITICEKIVENSYYIKIEKNGVKVKKLHVNSPAKYMLYCLNLVRQYTKIEVDFKNVLEEFNLLNKCEVIDVIYNNIPEKETKEFSMLLEMVENDIIQNEYETHAFISNSIERFGELFGSVVKPALSRLSDVVENMDEKTVNTIADRIKNLNGLK